MRRGLCKNYLIHKIYDCLFQGPEYTSRVKMSRRINPIPQYILCSTPASLSSPVFLTLTSGDREPRAVFSGPLCCELTVLSQHLMVRAGGEDVRLQTCKGHRQNQEAHQIYGAPLHDFLKTV